MSIKAYDPKKATAVIGGQTPTGLAPDTKYLVSRTNAISTVTEGIDGDISINIDSRFSGTFTLSLLHNSPFNDVISSWVYALDSTGYPFLPFELNDPSGSSISTVCWVETQPDYSVAQETGTLDWVFGLADCRLLPNQETARISLANQLTPATI